VAVPASRVRAGGGAAGTLSVNPAQAREYEAAARARADGLGLTPSLRIEWLLAQPGVLARDAEPVVAPEEGWALVARALEAALADLVARREAEGKALAQELGTL